MKLKQLVTVWIAMLMLTASSALAAQWTFIPRASVQGEYTDNIFLEPVNEEDDFTPKFSRELKACAFESKQPIDGKHYNIISFSCTEYINGEGYDIIINSYNQYSKQSEEKSLSLHMDEINGILACLNHLKYFDE